MASCVSQILTRGVAHPIFPDPSSPLTSLLRLPLGVPHRVAQDDWYEGMLIPKGATVVIPTYAIHHSEMWNFKDPEEFNPERFLNHPRLASDYAGSPDFNNRDKSLHSLEDALYTQANMQCLSTSLRLRSRPPHLPRHASRRAHPVASDRQDSLGLRH